MKCRKIRRIIYRYLDGRLDAEYVGIVEQHLKSCTKCTDVIRLHKVFYTILDSSGAVNAPEHFQEKVMDSVSRTDDRGAAYGYRSPQFRYQPVFKRLGASMILAALVLLVGFYRPAAWGDTLGNTFGKETDRVIQSVSHITNVFDEVNYFINSIFTNINNSIERFKEV